MTDICRSRFTAFGRNIDLVVVFDWDVRREPFKWAMFAVMLVFWAGGAPIWATAIPALLCMFGYKWILGYRD